jgi:hypothetical protein
VILSHAGARSGNAAVPTDRREIEARRSKIGSGATE